MATAGFTKVNFGQSRRAGLPYRRPMMLNTARVSKSIALAGSVLAGLSSVVVAQTNYYNPNGTEYAVIGSLPGDQMLPDAAISTTGGFVVWQDNITDGTNWGVSARRLDSTLSGTLSPFRVNQQGAGSQENARVALLKNGGAAFVWQGGQLGYQHIFARLLTPTNTFLTADILVSTATNSFQINPAVCVLNNSNLVVVWSSNNQAGSNSMQDVYAQILSPAGQKIGGEFLVNQFTKFNQRTPTIAPLANGGFVVGWVSEQQRQLAGTNGVIVNSASVLAPSVDIYARTFTASGTAAAAEFLVSANNKPSSLPAVAVATDGSYCFVWTARDTDNGTNSLDVYGRAYSSGGTGGTVFLVNTHTYGDQYAPRISALALDYLVTWTSLAQDGSREGVYAQFVHNNGALVGSELRVNTTTISQQMQPVVASDGANQFLVFWSSFTGLPNNFDVLAQRYVNASAILQAMPAPSVWAPFVMVSNVYQPRLVVTWAPVLGLSISNYEVYVDGAAVPTGLTASNQWTMTAAQGLTTNSTHSFQVDYLLTDGRRAPISPATSWTTWRGPNWGGIPYEWMAQFFGGYYNGSYNTAYWPSASTPLQAGNSATLLNVFVSGGNPLDASTWLKMQLSRTAQGLFLSWNTQPGAIYQLQVMTSLGGWSNLGSPRYAAGTTDSIYVGGSAVGLYRVQLLR